MPTLLHSRLIHLLFSVSLSLRSAASHSLQRSLLMQCCLQVIVQALVSFTSCIGWVPDLRIAAHPTVGLLRLLQLQAQPRGSLPEHIHTARPCSSTAFVYRAWTTSRSSPWVK